MKIGLLFGSFNPIHNGHLMIANRLKKLSEADQVWLVISPQNPFKTSSSLLSFEKRLLLIRAAIKNHTDIQVCTIEQHLPTPSYTIDTMQCLTKKYPDFTFCIYAGADILEHIHQWKSSEALLNTFTFFIYDRVSENYSSVKHPNINIYKLPMIDISATEIRGNIYNKQSNIGMIDADVAALIDHFQWYQ